MTAAKPSLISLGQTFRVTDEMIVHHRRVLSIMGCLMFIMIWTRSDIAYSVNILSRFLTGPTESLVKAVKRIIVYLKLSCTLGLRLSQPDNEESSEGNMIVTEYVDASDADCLITHRSTIGQVLFIGQGITLWKVGCPPFATLSMAESHPLQIGMAVQDVKHPNDLLEGLGFPQVQAKLNEDNQPPCRSRRTLTRAPRSSIWDTASTWLS
jgi:hypothetical protein